MNGQIFTGGGGRIVGPEYDALKFRDVLDDLDLQVAFVDDLEIQASPGLTMPKLDRRPCVGR